MSEDSNTRGRSALILGATGLVGRYCLDFLLESGRYHSVLSLGRRRLDLSHPRLRQMVIELDAMGKRPELFAVNDVFCCLGTTIRVAGSREAFRKVDVDYPVRAATLAADAGADQFLVVSALGADPDSRIFYNRMKGEMEAGVRGVAIQAVWVLRPALLLGSREEKRPGERIAEILFKPLSPLLPGRLKRFRPVHARDVAAAMVALAEEEGTGGVVESDQIATLGRGDR